MNFSNYFNDVFLENFENAMNFLVNPENRDKYLDDLEKEFEADGGTIIQNGVYGRVYLHPKWNYVLKTFVADECYLKFIRHAMRNPMPAFPRVIGSPHRVVPQYRRHWSQDKTYLVRLEKLEQLPFQDYAKIVSTSRILYKKELYDLDEPLSDKTINEELKDWDKLREFFLGLNKLLPVRAGMFRNARSICSIDLHNGNVMKRPSDGQYVITDPFAHANSSVFKIRNNRQQAELSVRNPSNKRVAEKKNVFVPGGKLSKPAQRQNITDWS